MCTLAQTKAAWSASFRGVLPAKSPRDSNVVCPFAGLSYGEANCTNPSHLFFSIVGLRGAVPGRSFRCRPSGFKVRWLKPTRSAAPGNAHVGITS